MRNRIVYIITLFLAALICVSAGKQGARIEFPENRTIDLGLIDGDTISSGAITFRNTGDEPLVITQVFADCNCTVPDYPRDPVEPGDSARITVRYDGRGFRHGPFLKVIKVRSNSDKPLVNLFVKGTIRRPKK